MDQKIKTGVAMGIILSIAVSLGGLIWFENIEKKQAEQDVFQVNLQNDALSQYVARHARNQNEKSTESNNAKNTIDNKEENAIDSMPPEASADEKKASGVEIPEAKDGTDQPAYLISAYSKDGKNFVDVDYVEWLHGEYSIKAQVEDGICPSANECVDYPNGYKRNRNPKIRTLELSPSARIEVSGSIAATDEVNEEHFGDPFGRKLSISFEKFENAVSNMTSSSVSVKAPFQKPKTFIVLTLKNNRVDKIVEPYQE